MESNRILKAYFIASLIILSSIQAVFAFQQKPPSNNIRIIDAGTSLREIATLPKHIKEASGLEITKGKNLWTHNDGGLPMLYCLDSLGTVVRSIQLNHPNSGWEDLAQDEKGNLYVGAFGNNKNDKQSLKIYKVPEPDSIKEKVFSASVIKFKYSDQKAFPPPPPQRNFDMDAMIAMKDSLYLFSKNRTSPFTGYTKVYALPQEPGEYNAMVVDSIFLGKGPIMDNWVTAADLSPDGKTLALLSHQCIWLIQDFNGSKFSSGKISRINLNHFSHKAGLCFQTNTHLFIVDELELELIGGKLYSINIQQLLQNPQ